MPHLPPSPLLPIAVFSVLAWTLVFYQNLIACLTLWALLFYTTFFYPKPTVSNYNVPPHDFSLIPLKPYPLLVVSSKLPTLNTQWRFLLKIILPPKKTCLLITQQQLWHDSLLQQLPKNINKHCVYTPKLYLPQLSTPCHLISQTFPDVSCTNHNHDCTCHYLETPL